MLHDWARKPYPLSASCYDGDSLTVRLSGEERAVQAARKLMGGDVLPDGDDFWHKLREHEHGFFASRKPLWRLSLASDASPLELPGKWLYEWGGAQRWLVSEAPAATIREAASSGRWPCHPVSRRPPGTGLPAAAGPALLHIHRRLKQAFDPDGLFNPGRMYEAL